MKSSCVISSFNKGVQNELNQKQTALAKAQKGVQQLQKLDASFTTFDRASDEAMNILMQFYNAINNNDIVAAQSYDCLLYTSCSSTKSRCCMKLR